MGSLRRYFRIIVKLFTITLFAALLITLRYLLSIPQELESILPGKPERYKWTHGSIFYKVLGSPAAPPLVLVHAPEIGASSYEMRNLVDGLARRYRVYILDLAGFGLSERPDIAYSATLYSALLRDFLKDIVMRPAVVIASGLSSSYAVALADSEPTLCERLILLAPEAAFAQKKVSRGLQWLIELPAIVLLSYAFVTARFVLRRVIARQRGLQPQQIVPGELDYLFASAHQPGAQHIWKATVNGELNQLGMKQLAALSQPILIIQGSQTTPISAHLTTRTRVISIPDTGLRVHEESPTKVVSTIIEWLMPALDQLISTPIAAAKYTDLLISEALLPVLEYESVVHKEPVMLQHRMPDDVAPTPQEREPVKSLSNVIEVTPIEAYCVKCRAKKLMQNSRRIITKNGRSAMEGICPICGTKLFRFISG